MYLTDKTIANLIQSELNTTAESLYDDTTIDNKVVFFITPNVATYDEKVEMEFKTNDNILYTPILLQRTSSNMIDDYVLGTYIEAFNLEILGYEEDKEDLEKILDQYVYEENLNDSKTVGTWKVLKSNTSRAVFMQTIASTNGTNKKRIRYMISFTWEFILGGLKDESSTFTIDGTQVDVIGAAYTSDKTTISNIEYADTNVTPIGATGFTLSLTLPVQTTNAKNIALFQDLQSKKFNKAYEIVWTIDGFTTKTYSMIMRSGGMNYGRDQLLSYTLTFEEAYPRTTITIDGEVIPVITFNYQRMVKLIPNAEEEETKVVPTETSYAMTMKLGYDATNSTNVKLLQTVLDKAFMQETFTVVVEPTGIVPITYTCVLTNGQYGFENTGELMYDVTFQEVHENGV